MSFKSFIGNEKIRNQIETSIKMGMFSHAHLIIGEDGLGKSLLARQIALNILGKNEDREYADLVEYKILKNKQSIGIREVTDKVIGEINKKPYEGDKKVIIIYEAHKMTVDAQNAFLKTIEEPPKGVFIILLCENSEAILDTIKSRCQVHKLQRLNYEEMQAFIDRRFPELSAEEVKTIVTFSDGIPGRAEKLVEDQEFKEIRNLAIKIILDINSNETVEFLKHEERLTKYKNNWQEVLSWIISYIRDAMVYKETANQGLVINQDKLESIKDIASMFSFNRLSDIIDIVNKARQKLDRNVNVSLIFTNMLLKFLDT